MKRSCGALSVVVLLVLVLPSRAHADLILQPAAASSSTSDVFGAIGNLHNQSGLSSGYTSLVTDFDAYIAANPTHDSSSPDNFWTGFRPEGESVTFDLGGTHTIESMALWNIGGNSALNIVGVTLVADDNPAFSSPTLLSTFNADPNTGPMDAVLPQVITFAPTSASWVRLTIDSVLDAGPQTNGFGEVAFEVVPEPAAVAVLAVTMMAATLRRRR